MPRIMAAGTVAGPTEAAGPLGNRFDAQCTDSPRQTSWETMEQDMFRQAVQITLRKAVLQAGDLDLAIGGDLNAQLSSFYFAHRDVAVPAFGLFSACATFTQAMALAGLAVDSGVAKHVLVGTSSHNSTAERQFRYPTEYGAQRPLTAQRTVTGAGAAVLSLERGTVALTHATVGMIEDYGIKNPWEMGAAMAPAAEATILAHLQDTGRTFGDYDCVATGDLGRVGNAILTDLFARRGLVVNTDLTDCGMLIYRPDQPEVFSGGSGAACSTLVTLGHFVKKLEQGEWRRILVAATGALLSAVTAQQSETIPAICHAIVLERKDG